MKRFLLTCAVGLLAGSAYGQAPDLSGLCRAMGDDGKLVSGPCGGYNDGIIHGATPIVTDMMPPTSGMTCVLPDCGLVPIVSGQGDHGAQGGAADPFLSLPVGANGTSMVVGGAGDHAQQGGSAASVQLTVLRGHP